MHAAGAGAEGVGKEPAVQERPVSLITPLGEQFKGDKGQTHSGPDGRVAVELAAM